MPPSLFGPREWMLRQEITVTLLALYFQMLAVPLLYALSMEMMYMREAWDFQYLGSSQNLAAGLSSERV